MYFLTEESASDGLSYLTISSSRAQTGGVPRLQCKQIRKVCFCLSLKAKFSEEKTGDSDSHKCRYDFVGPVTRAFSIPLNEVLEHNGSIYNYLTSCADG